MPHLFVACPGLYVTKEVREWGWLNTRIYNFISHSL